MYRIDTNIHSILFLEPKQSLQYKGFPPTLYCLACKQTSFIIFKDTPEPTKSKEQWRENYEYPPTTHTHTLTAHPATAVNLWESRSPCGRYNHQDHKSTSLYQHVRPVIGRLMVLSFHSPFIYQIKVTLFQILAANENAVPRCLF